MRVTFPVCAAGTIGLSTWLMGALVAPGLGPTAQPTVSPPVDNRSNSADSLGLDEVSARHGPAGTFVLTGRVVDAATGDAIRGADVNASSDDNRGFASTTSDQRGNWTLNRLPAGGYHVIVRKAEYQVKYSGLPLIALTDARPQRVLNLALARGSALGGRITNSTGRPAVGMTVGVFRVVRGAEGASFQFEGDMTESDDSGAFRLSGLQDGEYVLAAQLFGGLSPNRSGRAEVKTFYPGTAVSAEAERFKLVAGTVRTGLTFSMQSMQTASVSGHVVSSTGQPVAAEVSFQKRDDSPNGWGGFGPQSGSRFTLPHLAPGHYRIVARTSPGAGRREAAMVDVTVGQSDIRDLALRTKPLATIRGRVVASGYDDWALDWMRIGAMPVDTRESSNGEPAIVRSDRTFELQTHHAPARVVAFQPLSGWAIHTVRWNGRDFDDGVLSLKPGDVVSDVEVVLRRRASIIEGVVRDASGRTCVLVLRRGQDGKPACVMLNPVRDGEFRTMPLLAGEYRVVAQNESRQTPIALDALWAAATPVTLADDQTVALTLGAQKRP